jgi:hypothetical protein
VLCNVLSISTPWADVSSSTATNEECVRLDVVLSSKKQLYSKIFPDIYFVLLRGGESWTHDMVGLSVLLGYQPVNLDYEHPPELREELMFASLERLALMLRHQVPSASLFEADDPLGWPQNICVLTIDPTAIASSHKQATRHLLGVSKQTSIPISDERLIRCDEYVEFVFHHEVYHCLSSLYLGPQSMSNKELWGEYNHYTDEQGANAFAMSMLMRSRGQQTERLDNFFHLRGMSLLSGDPDHWTCDTLQDVMDYPKDKLVSMSVREVFELANRFRRQRQLSYQDYLGYLAASIKAMKLLRVKTEISPSVKKILSKQQVDDAKARELANRVKACYRELTGEEYDP